jgi:subfamily B ATP-binding cassette protein MsbA
MYLRTLKLLASYQLHLFLALICMVVFALSNGAMAYLIGPVIQYLFTSGSNSIVNIIPYGAFTLPKEWITLAIPLAIIMVAVVKGISSFGQAFFMGYVSQGVIRDIRKRLYEHILNMPVNFFNSNPTGNLISRLTNDVNLLQSATAESLSTMLKQSLTIIVLSVIIISLDWRLALAAAVGIPLSVYPMRRFGKKMKQVSTKGQITMGAMTALLHEAIAGIRIVKAFCMEGYESKRFEKDNERYTQLRLKSIKVRAISSPIVEFLGSLGFALTIWYAGHRIAEGTLRPEAFISFFAAVLMLYQPVKSLNGVNLNIQNGMAAAARIFELLDTPGETTGGGGELNSLNDSIEFKNVSFKYADEWVLKNIDLTIKKGEMIAIVGSSGAGKTTLVNLLPRFYDLNEGAILFDGTDIKELSLKSLRSKIAIVSQQIVLFNDTVKNNIAYGQHDRRDEEVIEAAKAANANEFINRLPDGYNTIIGEGGVTLSGGQRQRLSIARAILKNAPLLILDEATSSLDTESELEVQRGLTNLMKGRTTFVIAHRLSTVRKATRIIVLADGKIKEIGGHDELINTEGEYFRLYSMQFG